MTEQGKEMRNAYFRMRYKMNKKKRKTENDSYWDKRAAAAGLPNRKLTEEERVKLLFDMVMNSKCTSAEEKERLKRDMLAEYPFLSDGEQHPAHESAGEN